MVLAFSLPEKTGPSPSTSPSPWRPLTTLVAQGWTLLGSSGTSLKCGFSPGIRRVALPVSGREGITSLSCSPLQFAFSAARCWLPFQLASAPAPGPFPARLLLRQLSPACADAGGSSALGAELCAFPSWTRWGFFWPRPQVCCGGSVGRSAAVHCVSPLFFLAPLYFTITCRFAEVQSVSSSWLLLSVFGALRWPPGSSLANLQLDVRPLLAAQWTTDPAGFPAQLPFCVLSLGFLSSQVRLWWETVSKAVLKSKYVTWAIQLSSEPPPALCMRLVVYVLPWINLFF